MLSAIEYSVRPRFFPAISFVAWAGIICCFDYEIKQGVPETTLVDVSVVVQLFFRLQDIKRYRLLLSFYNLAG